MTLCNAFKHLRGPRRLRGSNQAVHENVHYYTVYSLNNAPLRAVKYVQPSYLCRTTSLHPPASQLPVRLYERTVCFLPTLEFFSCGPTRLSASDR